MAKNPAVADFRLILFQGTLDLMVLCALDTYDTLNGYAAARKIEQVSHHSIVLNQGTIHASLVRLQRKKYIAAKWGTSEMNRKAKQYSITPAGKKHLREGLDRWNRLSEILNQLSNAGWNGLS